MGGEMGRHETRRTSAHAHGSGEVEAALLQPLLRLLLLQAEVRPEQRRVRDGHAQGVVDQAQVHVVQAHEDLRRRAGRSLGWWHRHRRRLLLHERRRHERLQRRRLRLHGDTLLPEQCALPRLLRPRQLQSLRPPAPGLELDSQAACHLWLCTDMGRQ